MTDIKQALAAAFDDEPPLTIDRAAILRTGRRKAAFRRGYTAITVLATATVVCVPAVLGSGGGGGDGNAQVGGAAPARSTTPTTASAPPVTSAPATGSSSPNPATGSSSPNSATGGPSTTRMSIIVPAPPEPPTSGRAIELTALLASSGAIPADAQSQRYADYPTGPWEFGVVEGGYETAVDVTTAAGRGRVMVGLGGGGAPKCRPESGNPRSTCEERLFEGHPIVVTVSMSNDTQPVTFVAVHARKADGTLVEATAMNGNIQKTGITGVNLPLTVEQLAKIATLPGLTF
ncbi:hypothetical protein [Saccharothrix xinjiangensis]|uniref:Uncharacterized protein n=1 Tax=Saccharothrix xinjiangensis TaxID=204798 RepID=A0ABV9Y182_9PSEU